MRVQEPTAWAVYRVRDEKKAMDQILVCSQPEWDAMEIARPGSQTLIQGNIRNEGEAEQIARKLQTPLEPAKKSRTSAFAKRPSPRPAAAGTAPPESTTPQPSQ